MALQATGSRSALLLQCPYPFTEGLELPAETEVREATRYGLAYHYVMSRVVPKAIARRKALAPKPALVARALLAQGISSDDVRTELREHVVESVGLLIAWLRGENEFDVCFFIDGIKVAVEESWAVRLHPSRTAERIAPPDENHVYDLDSHRGAVVPMTLDLRIFGPRYSATRREWNLFTDYKTGRLGSWSQPGKVPQMLSASAISLDSRYQADETYLTVVDANRAGISAVYADRLGLDEIEAYVVQLLAAYGLIGSGFIRSGDECRWCPARDVCPAQWKSIVEEGHAIVKAMTGGLEAIALGRRDDALGPLEKAGALNQAFSTVDKLKRRVKPEIRKLVEAGEIVTQPNGEILTLKPHDVERMPQKSDYEEKYGKARAEREFAKLRRRGLLATKKEIWMEAEPNERIRR